MHPHAKFITTTSIENIHDKIGILCYCVHSQILKITPGNNRVIKKMIGHNIMEECKD